MIPAAVGATSSSKMEYANATAISSSSMTLAAAVQMPKSSTINANAKAICPLLQTAAVANQVLQKSKAQCAKSALLLVTNARMVERFPAKSLVPGFM